jgi:Tfp pilus assembly protein PilF
LEEQEFLFQRGLALLQIGDLEGAGDDAEAAVQAAPEWPYGYFLRAATAEASGDVHAAVEDYQRSSDLAGEIGEYELAAAARVQLGLLIQYPAQNQTPSTGQ